MDRFTVKTKQHTQFVNIDGEVQEIVQNSGIDQGVCHVFIPHTTAAITINENADPDVVTDLIETLERIVPWKDHYRHAEGNSAAHLKASLMGTTQTVLIHDARLALGTWQSLFLCEFDGPRKREVWVATAPANPPRDPRSP